MISCHRHGKLWNFQVTAKSTSFHQKLPFVQLEENQHWMCTNLKEKDSKFSLEKVQNSILTKNIQHELQPKSPNPRTRSNKSVQKLKHHFSPPVGAPIFPVWNYLTNKWLEKFHSQLRFVSHWSQGSIISTWHGLWPGEPSSSWKRNSDHASSPSPTIRQSVEGVASSQHRWVCCSACEETHKRVNDAYPSGNVGESLSRKSRNDLQQQQQPRLQLPTLGAIKSYSECPATMLRLWSLVSNINFKITVQKSFKEFREELRFESLLVKQKSRKSIIWQESTTPTSRESRITVR